MIQARVYDGATIEPDVVKVCEMDEQEKLARRARRQALEQELLENWKDLPPMPDRTREMTFFARHPELAGKLAGQWVALDGDELIGHGTDLAAVIRQAWDSGHEEPFVTSLRDPKIAHWIY